MILQYWSTGYFSVSYWATGYWQYLLPVILAARQNRPKLKVYPNPYARYGLGGIAAMRKTRYNNREDN